MTAPLTPPGCDLRGMAFMPLDVARLLDSDTVALTDGREFKAAFLLWARSWTQVPAASVPADERLLCRMVSLSLNEWREVSDMALRGWVECDDGRLYHPVVAEKALQAWIERVAYKARSSKANAAKHEGFKHSPEAFDAMRRDAVIHLERLVPGSGVSFGIVLQGDEITPSGSRSAPTRSVSPPKREGEERDSESERDSSLVASPAASATPDVQSAFDAYNDVARELGLPVARDLTAKRTGKIARTLKAKGLSGWSEALDALRDSPHCQGRNDRGWKADLDFLLQEDSFQRLTEGRYAGRPTPTPSGGGSYMDLVMERMA